MLNRRTDPFDAGIKKEMAWLLGNTNTGYLNDMDEKQFVVKMAKSYLRKGNNVCNLTDLVVEKCSPEFHLFPFIRDVAYKMQRTGKYKAEIHPNEQVLVVPLSKDEVIFSRMRWLTPVLALLISIAALTVSIIALLRK